MNNEQLRELLNSLTLEEKVGQMVQLTADYFGSEALETGYMGEMDLNPDVASQAGSVQNVSGADKVRKIQQEYLEKDEHKIPLLFMSDIIHGYRTVNPVPLGLGSTWNMELVKEGIRLVAKEAYAGGAHVTFSPMVDLVRDARWGRCMESAGEDKYLNAQYARAVVEGFQEKIPEGQGIAACVKHFAAYSGAEAGRDYNTVDISERRLREEYMAAYKAAVDAGVEVVMTSFNTIDEIPATGNRWLLEDVLRKEWGFQGVIITDYSAIYEMIKHGVAENEREAAKLAIQAGVDIDMMSPCYANHLPELVRSGEVEEEQIDMAVWRILQLKNKLGLFENPYRGLNEEEEQRQGYSDEHREIVRKAAEEACVLLKNEKNVLPLAVGQKIALVGPYADNHDVIGMWSIHSDRRKSVTLKEAFEEMLPQGALLYAKGCDTLEDYSTLGSFAGMSVTDSKPPTPQEEQADWEEARTTIRASDVVVVALGEHMMQSGESASRTDIHLPEIQRRFLKRVAGEGKPVVLVTYSGRPLVLTEDVKYADAILHVWFPGTEAGHAVSNQLFGRVNPSGRLSMSFPYATGQVPVYYDHFNTGRPADGKGIAPRFTSGYLDSQNDPLYPFGYGLSYHTAAYDKLELSTDCLHPGEKLQVSVEVQNTSKVAGKEVVQLYLHDVVGSVVRPVKELKGFQKISLEAGEKKKVTFTITEDTLKFHTKDMQYEAEPGRFEVMVGNNSEEVLGNSFLYVK